MVLTTAASNNVVDLSEDNDSAATAAGITHLPSSNPSESFERSCDNPECSAPRLIAQVPKRDTSEFITQPMVIPQPTLINGFTTVFQIDGVGTRMEDLMNDPTAAENNTLEENSKPKTVFRVVPNTHAHIVNYVVVDSADETMRKIKASDPETMRKLLVSQRLSAEQMLKKLIGKALETPTRVDNLRNAPAPAPAPVTVPSPVAVSTPKVPPGITIKLLSASEAKKATSSSTSTSAVKTFSNNQISIKPATESNKTASPQALTPSRVNVSSEKHETPKSTASINQKTNQTTSQLSAVAQSTSRQTTGSGRVIAATKPVVWQAVPPGTASSTPLNKTTPPRIAPTISPQKTEPVVKSPTMMPSSSNTSALQQPLNTTEMLDVEKAISASSISVKRNLTDSQSSKQQNVLKRKTDLNMPIPEAIKRLRPRSPTRIQNLTPLAGNVSKIIDTPPPNKKLPMRPSKYQGAQTPQKLSTFAKKIAIAPKAQVQPTDDHDITLSETTSNKKDTSAIDTQNTLEPSPPAELDAPVRRKSKPLMGPASKMKALRAIADAKTKALQKDEDSECKQALVSESGRMKIGETIISRTETSMGATETVEPAETFTKPCSVAITDIAKNNDSDSDSKAKRSKPTLRSTSEKEQCNITNKKQSPFEDFVDKYQGRWTIKNDDGTPVRRSFVRSTRSSVAPKATLRTAQKPEASNTSAGTDDISDSTLLTTPSAPSRVLRVVLPSTKNGIVNNPSTSPHPNLKISSVISGGTTLAPSIREVDTEIPPIIINDVNSGPGIEQLQKELADLRRTVARLTQGKNL